MVIQYNIVLTIINLTDSSTSKFSKIFEQELSVTDALLYNNYHILSKGVYIIDMFEDEISAYCTAMGLEQSSIEIEEFEIVSLTSRTEVFFEPEEGENTLSLKPIIKCYVYPEYDALKTPKLVGVAYDSNTIIWSWPEDEEFAHYLVKEAVDPDSEEASELIIAQLPIGAVSYTETGLDPDTAYTRRLINYTNEQTSSPSPSVTVKTETAEISETLEEYTVSKNYDFTTDDTQKEIIDENLEAFHSGIGDHNDLKVYKQMDADFYQKFKAYFELTGRRVQREKRYEQVGFYYKICLEATETIEEQEGEVTFDLNVYPREWISIQQYMYATMPVKVYARLYANILLRKNTSETTTINMDILDPVYVPGETYTSFIGDPLRVFFILDATWSIYHLTPIINGSKEAYGYRNAIRKGVCNCIDTINTKKLQIEATTGSPIDIKYQAIVFTSGHYGYTTMIRGLSGWIENPETMKSWINTDVADGTPLATFNGYDLVSGNTSWAAGIDKAVEISDADVGSGINAKYVSYLFSDGYPNTTNNNVVYENSSTDNGNGTGGLTTGGIILVENIQSCMDKILARADRWAYYGCLIRNNGSTNNNYVNYYDSRYDTLYSSQLIQECHTRCGQPSEGRIFWDSATDIESAFSKVVDKYTTTITGDPVFDHFDTITVPVEVPTSMDSVKSVRIETELLGPFTFDNSVTPVSYSSKEQRAVINKSDFIPAFTQKLSETSVYKLLLDAAENTQEWTDGYNLPVGGPDENTYLITGLSIKDTYAFADEDVMTSATFNESFLEDGMTGSVNVYTDVNTVDTDTFGDDTYYVTKNNYVYIDGYTDGIIYDGTRFATAELNAYSNPSEILVDAAGNYSDQLYNRKNKNINYSGAQSSINSIIKVLEIDDDINVTGMPSPVVKGSSISITGIPSSIVASISEHYQSPILNYRFNLEDPDAKTPFYEILPMANTEENYLNVVILHVYYAKNVYISNYNNYVSQFGNDPIATESTPYMALVEGMNSWETMEWRDGIGNDNGKYIDEYLWFEAKPMIKTQEYYDELPDETMDSFYGLVNGRYRTDNQNGKQNLTVDTPQFNIPTTVNRDTIRIYIMISESHPENALISYRWETPWNNKDDITMVNGDYVYFSSDNVVYKDVEYYDVIATINMDNQEIFDQKTTELIYAIQKPETHYEYLDYYLNVVTDNSDVMVMRYPTQITFDETSNDASVGVAFKGVVNATSQWAPRIHNGYYYLNQHEYFAYSEFDVVANFDTYEETDFKTINGYLSIDVNLRHIATAAENYTITKDTRSELLQDEDNFQWVEGKGLTLKPFIDGEYYREYLPKMYISPVILFPNVLTETGTLNVSYTFDDGSEYFSMEVRSYNLEDGAWGDWVDFTNNTIPNVDLSCAYQVRFLLFASVQNHEISLEDYMCCYLDWKDDINDKNTTNIVTITDHMTTGPDAADGIYISRVIDYGCKTTIQLDMFYSNYDEKCELYIAYSDEHEDALAMENIIWKRILDNSNKEFKARFFRYKIVVPEDEKLYWLHKQIRTLETTEILPYVTGVSMTGTYTPSDIVTNFINTESFNIPKDGESHVIVDSITDIIGADVLERGYTYSEIENLNIQCTTSNIEISFNENLLNPYPTAYLNSPIYASSDIDFNIIVKNTPYIFVEQDFEENNFVTIIGTPQQYCPISVEDVDGKPFTELYNTTSFLIEEEYVLTEDTKYIELKTNQYDPESFNIYVDEVLLSLDDYRIVNHLVIFDSMIQKGHTISVSYYMLNTFIAQIDRDNNTTTIYLYTGQGIDIPEKVKVFFETGTKNNKFIANDLSLNPIYRTDYKGFIYLTDEHNEPYKVNIYCNPKRLKAGGYDKVDIVIEVLDIKGNPIISKDVAVDCTLGILNCESYTTDMNGVVHLVYESSYMVGTDTLTARVLNDSSIAIQNSITIENI